MSMHQMGKRGIPKGAVVSPTRRAILQHLQMHGECAMDALYDAFKGFSTWRLSATHEPPKGMGWLDGHLRHLRSTGHVTRRVDDAGQVFWSIGTDQSAKADDQAEPEEMRASEAAEPRQVNVMHGPVYQPPAFAPARAGALQHTAFKSLMGNRLVAYRGGK